MSRPLIAIPARFAATASALRYAAEVTARALAEAVWRAGGEPVTIHPHAPGGAADPDEVADRLGRFDGVLLPGGGDVAPHRYGEAAGHESVYDVDDEQDGFDLELARRALAARVPLLAICRGLQVVNVALDGTLHQHMDGPEQEHRDVVHPVAVVRGSLVERAMGVGKVEVSCYHHQRVARMGPGLAITAVTEGGVVEALELPEARGWFVAVQWHPEDTAPDDPAQEGLFHAFVRAARDHVRNAGSSDLRADTAAGHAPGRTVPS